MGYTGSWVWDVRAAAPVYWSAEMYRIHGRDAVSTPPSVDAYRSHYSTEDWCGWLDALQKSAHDRTGFKFTSRVVMPDGFIKQVLITGHPVTGAADEVTEVIGSTAEVNRTSGNRSAQTEITEDPLIPVIDLIPGLVWSARQDGSLAYCNKVWLEYTGLTSAEAMNWGWIEAIHPDDLSRLQEYWLATLATCQAGEIEARLRRFDGEYRWFLFRARPHFDSSGDVVNWYGTNTDIEDRKQAEQGLRESERQLHQLVETIPALIWRGTPDGELDYLNQRYIDFIGQAADNLAGGRWMEFVDPDHRTAVVEKWLHSVHTRSPYRDIYRLRRADGQYRWIQSVGEPLLDSEGRITRWYGLVTDIDERKRAEDALRESELNFRLIVDTIPALVCTMTAKGEVELVNQQVLNYFGRTLEELKDWAFIGAVHEDDLVRVIAHWRHSVESGEPYEIEHRIRQADGAFRWFHVRGHPLRDSQGSILRWYILLNDIEDRKRARDALLNSQTRLARMSQLTTVAELSASIAHEVNQPLAAIMANGQACLAWLTGDPPNLERARVTAQKIIRDTNSAAEVVRRMRALFKQAPPAKSITDINDTIAEVLRMIADEVHESAVLIETDLALGLPVIVVDRVQIQQILINLTHNAIEAMGSVVERPKTLSLSSRLTGSDILVQVGDNGCGIENPAFIFDPFFTTKPNGMGMGLAICRSIIEAHDGRLWSTPNAGAGTTFSFTLPVARDAPL